MEDALYYILWPMENDTNERCFHTKQQIVVYDVIHKKIETYNSTNILTKFPVTQPYLQWNTPWCHYKQYGAIFL